MLIDDGSTDASPNIAAKYGGLDRRVRLLHHRDRERLGAAASRNVGIREANGGLITFLDGDDTYLPNKLSVEMEVLHRVPDAAAVYGATIWSHADGRPDCHERLGVPAGRTYEPPELVTRIMLGLEGDVPCTCSIMVRRDLAIAVGGFEERFRLFEDQTFLVKLFIGYPIYVSNHREAVYRQHSELTSAVAARTGAYIPGRRSLAELEYLAWVESYIAAEGIVDAKLAAALADRLAVYRSPMRTRVRRLFTAIIGKNKRNETKGT